ncbi:hypothetical protein SAMN03159297_00915 [Pseudomonas sp. NFACC45]|nr:hypothetical protein SAMN03159297_00915 [Pseudomonas sp. NFACC45]
MTSVIAVLTVAGLSFNMLSQHHFKMLDRQALVEKERIPLEPVPQELQQLVAAIRSERYE